MSSDPVSCADSLAALSSASLAELSRDGPIARHIHECPECSRVAQVVVERERSLALALETLPPRGDPALITETAMLARERRGTARIARFLLMAAAVATGWFALDATIGERERKVRATRRTETIEFRCLTPAQASDLIEPYVRSDGHGIYTAPAGIRGVTVRATAGEIASAASVIASFDRELVSENGACAVPPASDPLPGTKEIPKP